MEDSSLIFLAQKYLAQLMLNTSRNVEKQKKINTILNSLKTNIMKKLFVFAAFVIFAGFSNNVFAQTTAASTASATVVTARSVTKGADLNFGSMVSPAAAATVIVDPATTLRTVGTGTITLLTSGTPFSVASFTANGTAGASYTVTLPTGNIMLTSGANNMIVNGFVADGIAALNTAGSDVFNVGATLNVGANQPVGNYTATYDVTVVF